MFYMAPVQRVGLRTFWRTVLTHPISTIEDSGNDPWARVPTRVYEPQIIHSLQICRTIGRVERALMCEFDAHLTDATQALAQTSHPSPCHIALYPA
jgi:hypothetical protein